MGFDRVSAEKRALRATMREALRRHPPAQLRAMGRQATAALLDGRLWAERVSLFSFLSLSNEVDTEPIHRIALARGLPLALPRVEEHELRFRLVRDLSGPWEHNSYRIREPGAELPRFTVADAEAEAGTVLALVPGLAFDRAGRRLGRGGGYYDRFLAAARAEALRRTSTAGAPGAAAFVAIGVCFGFQLVERVPASSLDERVDYLLTDEGLHAAPGPDEAAEGPGGQRG